MVRVIINSDDFGLNNEVNKAIAEAFEKGLISSTTSLVNFTASLNEASELVSQGRVPKESVGIHLNLSEGQPLDPSSLKCELLCSGDEFHGAIRNKPVFHLSKKDAKIIYLELDAQLLKFISTYGFTPTHIDGHHHIHTEWAIMSIVIRLAKKYNIDKIRLTRNIGHGISISKKIYKKILNTRLYLRGINTTDYFGDFHDLKSFTAPASGSLEIMVHAIPSTVTNQINDLDNKSLNEKIRTLQTGLNLELINYTQL